MTESPINLDEACDIIKESRKYESRARHKPNNGVWMVQIGREHLDAIVQELFTSRERITELEVEKSIEKLVYDPTIPRYSSKESVIIPQAEDARYINAIIKFLSSENEGEWDDALEFLLRYLAAIEGGKR